MTDFQANIRIVGELEIGIDPEESQKWIATTINTARNILNIGMRDGPQSGRTYFHPTTGVAHIASRRGEWPAIRSGSWPNSEKLRQSTRLRSNEFEGEIGSNVSYAERLVHPTAQGGGRKLYKEALDLAIEEHIDELGDVIFIRQKAEE